MSNYSQDKTASAHHHTELGSRQETIKVTTPLRGNIIITAGVRSAYAGYDRGKKKKSKIVLATAALSAVRQLQLV